MSTITLRMFTDANGRQPFRDWLRPLVNTPAYKRIRARLDRLEKGNFGDCKAVGEGVHELRLFFDGGYRIYFGREGNTVVVLLSGGDKSSQSQDIKKAKAFWKLYKESL